MKVEICSPLQSYTRRPVVEAQGASLAEVLEDLDRRFPGLRFRIVDEHDRVRRHIRLFVNGVETERLTQRLSAEDELRIVAALSGG